MGQYLPNEVEHAPHIVIGEGLAHVGGGKAVLFELEGRCVL